MSSHQFRGKSARRNRKRGGFSQASTRRGITLYDQHDREWTCQVGNKSGMPTGLITPSFRAPWMPDQQFIRVNPDNTSELFIDYEAMILRQNARLTEYHKVAVEFARAEKLALPARKGEYADQIIGRLGNPPKAIQPIIAARQENVYILGPDYAEARGLKYEVDERLERFVVKPRNESILDEFDFAPGGSFADAKARNSRPAPSLAPAVAQEPDTTDEDLEEFELGDGGDESGVDDLIEQLEEEADPAALGGRTVAPQKTDHVRRQAPRRPGTKTATKAARRPMSSRAKHRAAQRGDRPTLATGAAPVIGSGEL